MLYMYRPPYQGLEEVRQQFLDIKSKVAVCKAQDPTETSGGPRKSGKTTIARLYAGFLHELKVIPSAKLEVASGIGAATLGAYGMKELIKGILREYDSGDSDGSYNDGSGVLFVDEAYQLTGPYVDGVGCQVLDIILTEMEENIGGDHQSRIPYTMTFGDFGDGELWRILVDNINWHYNGRMHVDKVLDGLYMRIAIRQLAGFGNAHAEDFIGPNPSVAARKRAACVKRREYTGLEHVKQCVERLIGIVKVTY
ncbi:hypothetical protein F4825DRAFT_452184 [Nemania diffusa]|nr:hypothetical protein F4825DRAFT_452184 [Nemania diffusa]